MVSNGKSITLNNFGFAVHLEWREFKGYPMFLVKYNVMQVSELITGMQTHWAKFRDDI